MADTSDRNTSNSNANAEEVDNLKRELANLKAAIAERAQDVYDGAAVQASRATEALRSQADVVRENPGTFSSAFFIGGLIGLLLGFALGSEQKPRRWYERD